MVSCVLNKSKFVCVCAGAIQGVQQVHASHMAYDRPVGRLQWLTCAKQNHLQIYSM